MGQSLRLGFLASHAGSSLREIVRAIEAGELNASVEFVISNNPDAEALEFARGKGIKTAHISATTAGSFELADAAIADCFKRANVEVIVLSGYLRKVGSKTLGAFPGKILNVHPSLLPKFGGRGMFGRAVHEAVLTAKEPCSGATIHIVDEEYDHGPVVARRVVPVRRGDDVDSIKARVMAIEPRLYIDALKVVAERRRVLPTFGDTLRSPLRVWSPGADGFKRWMSDVIAQFNASAHRRYQLHF